MFSTYCGERAEQARSDVVESFLAGFFLAGFFLAGAFFRQFFLAGLFSPDFFSPDFFSPIFSRRGVVGDSGRVGPVQYFQDPVTWKVSFWGRPFGLAGSN